jgi:hypothetical protein
VSNVRGPDVPLYMAGARLVSYVPVSIATDGNGLNVTGFSYAGTMWLCAISCREMLPDPAFFADCLRESFVEIRDAAAREAEEGVRPHSTTGPAIAGTGKPARRRAGKTRPAVAAAKAKASGDSAARGRRRAAALKPGPLRKGGNGRRARAVEPQA